MKFNRRLIQKASELAEFEAREQLIPKQCLRDFYINRIWELTGFGEPKQWQTNEFTDDGDYRCWDATPFEGDTNGYDERDTQNKLVRENPAAPISMDRLFAGKGLSLEKFPSDEYPTWSLWRNYFFWLAREHEWTDDEIIRFVPCCLTGWALDDWNEMPVHFRKPMVGYPKPTATMLFEYLDSVMETGMNPWGTKNDYDYVEDKDHVPTLGEILRGERKATHVGRTKPAVMEMGTSQSGKLACGQYVRGNERTIGPSVSKVPILQEAESSEEIELSETKGGSIPVTSWKQLQRQGQIPVFEEETQLKCGVETSVLKNPTLDKQTESTMGCKPLIHQSSEAVATQNDRQSTDESVAMQPEHKLTPSYDKLISEAATNHTSRVERMKLQNVQREQILEDEVKVRSEMGNQDEVQQQVERLHKLLVNPEYVRTFRVEEGDQTQGEDGNQIDCSNSWRDGHLASNCRKQDRRHWPWSGSSALGRANPSTYPFRIKTNGSLRYLDSKTMRPDEIVGCDSLSLTVGVQIWDRCVEALVDTGASVNVIDAHTVFALRSVPIIDEFHKHMKTADL